MYCYVCAVIDIKSSLGAKGYIPPNKIPYMTIVAFGDITDTWNVSIYMRIIDIKLQHFTIEINHRTMWGWAVQFWDNRTLPSLPCPTQKMSCLFWSPLTYLLNTMIFTTQTLHQIKSQDFIGSIKQHSKIFFKLLYHNLDEPRSSTQQNAIW